MKARRIHNSVFARKRRKISKKITGLKWFKEFYEYRRRRAHEKRIKQKSKQSL